MVFIGWRKMMDERNTVRQVTDYIANEQYKHVCDELRKARRESYISYMLFMLSFLLNISLLFNIYWR